MPSTLMLDCSLTIVWARDESLDVQIGNDLYKRALSIMQNGYVCSINPGYYYYQGQRIGG